MNTDFLDSHGQRTWARNFSFAVFSLFVLAGIAAEAGQAPQAWQAEWERTAEAAKKEGQVRLYISPQSSISLQAGVFQKRFPEIKIVTVVGSGSAILPRVFAERRAGRYLADVTMAGATTLSELHLARALDPIRDAMILPEVVDESRWWGGKHRYTDPERRYGFTFIGHPQSGGFYYNTRLVNPAEFKSFWDFLNPKWKGKIGARDIRAPGPGTGTANLRVFYYNPKLGPEYIRRLFSETDLTLFRDRRQGVDWLVTGKFPLCFFCTRSDVGTAKRQGLPVEEFGAMKEGMGLTSSSGNIGILNRAPHPNAAKVFVNWFLSREGQLALQREYVKHQVTASNSLRIDIPKDMLPQDERLEEGVEYIEVETPERMSMEPILKVYNEGLKAAGKY
jgi:iron(III) transport system substrate-binding protein